MVQTQHNSICRKVMSDAAGLYQQGLARAKPKALNHTFELMRFACAAAIVACHMHPPAGDYLAFSLSLFLILTSAFAVHSVRRGDPARFFAARARRILVPWLAWSGFYVIVNMVLTRDWRGPLVPDSPLSLLIGSSIHLWFLPFVLVVSGLVAFLVPLVTDRRRLFWLTAALIPAAIGSFYLHQLNVLPDPFGQWAYSMPAVLFGAVVAFAARFGTGVLPIVFLAVVTTCALALGSPLLDAPHLAIAAILFLLICRIEIRSPLLAEFGRLSFGVYLVHPFLMLVFYKLFGTDHSPFWAIVAVISMSALVSALMVRARLTRAFV
jgi:peptidoglycan/LPS O-acetylase OafA/YrhL